MTTDKLNKEALFSVTDLAGLIHSSEDLSRVLGFLVQKIAAIMHADACSLYLCDSGSDDITLKATCGLNPKMVDTLTLKRNMGLVAKTIETLEPFSTSNAQSDPLFLKIQGLGEEGFNSYLSVPLVYNGKPVGVIVVQNREKTKFNKADTELLTSLTIPAVSLVEKAKFKDTVEAIIPQAAQTPTTEKVETGTTIEYLKDHCIKGIPAVQGISMGSLKIVQQRFARRYESEDSKGLEKEIALLKEAFDTVSTEIRETKKKAEAKFGPDEASIFEAYLLFLESTNFRQQIVAEVHSGLSAIKALDKVVSKYMDRMSKANDEYIKERAYDIQDVARKISEYLLYGSPRVTDQFACTEDTIFSKEFWSISDFVNIDLKKTKGIISANGGASSHIAILADTLNLPTVLGLESAASQIKEGDYLIIDGYSGTILVNPSMDIIELYKREMLDLQKKTSIFQNKKEQKVKIGTTTKRHLAVGANLSMIVHTNRVVESGADMIGLYRTEFPFLIRNQMPTEEEQYLVYQRIIKMIRGKEITFRTLDIGGDKYVSYLNLPRESNPALGWRAIRFSLERKDLFRIQLRALLRASVHGRIRILFPMITTVEQVIEAKQILELVKKELTDEKMEYAKKIPIGAMIEVPSAVEMAATIAKNCDFFSLGTNDLIQYCLAVDRTNPQVAGLYDPFHPAVVRMVARTITEGHKADIKTCVCGDMASNPLLAALLIGLEADALSMIPRAIAKIKYLARLIDEDSSIALAKRCLKLETGAQIKKELENYFLENNLAEIINKEQLSLTQPPSTGSALSP
ncbi:MAG: phosphoenolpyruvate--protein phosphotransferase [Deltaproteobacteria bacterium]|nr:phosphoenolpyruvate--protein phosphotransferase [Deltaproteobacteria bacterium]